MLRKIGLIYPVHQTRYNNDRLLNEKLLSFIYVPFIWSDMDVEVFNTTGRLPLPLAELSPTILVVPFLTMETGLEVRQLNQDKGNETIGVITIRGLLEMSRKHPQLLLFHEPEQLASSKAFATSLRLVPSEQLGMSHLYMKQLSRYHHNLVRSGGKTQGGDIIQYSDILRGALLQYVVEEADVVEFLDSFICELSETFDFRNDASLRVQKSRYVCQYGKILQDLVDAIDAAHDVEGNEECLAQEM